MTDERRKRLLLGVLALVMALVVIKQVWPSLSIPGQGAVSDGSAGSRRASGAGVETTEVVELELDLLTKGAGQFTPGRDPFSYGAPPPPPPPPAPPPEVEEDRLRRAADAARALQVARETVATGPPPAQPPPIDLVYLGSFGTADKRLAVFSDGSEIYNALAGTVINEKFVVVQVGLESADLGFVGFPDVPAERLGAGE